MSSTDEILARHGRRRYFTAWVKTPGGCPGGLRARALANEVVRVPPGESGLRR
jgi:hypothetical protein